LLFLDSFSLIGSMSVRKRESRKIILEQILETVWMRMADLSGEREFGQLVLGMVDHYVMKPALISDRQVQVMSTLPLKAISRVWGKFNELEIPYYLRVPGFKLYSFVFGVK